MPSMRFVAIIAVIIVALVVIIVAIGLSRTISCRDCVTLVIQ
jgi:hypothetical protein